MVYHPAVHEVFGEEAVMVDDLTYAAMYEHVANGHQATGMVEIFCNQIITQVAYMICQQQPSACRVTDTFSCRCLPRIGTQDHQVADIRRGKELSVHLPTDFGRYCHEEVTERIKPSAGLQFPLHEPYPSGKHLHKMPVLLPFVFPVHKGRCAGREPVNDITQEIVENGYRIVAVRIGEITDRFLKRTYRLRCVVWCHITLIFYRLLLYVFYGQSVS